MLSLIKGGDVFGPEPLGKQDILVAGSQILDISPAIEVPNSWEEPRTVLASGKYVVPALVDQHVHFIGGGGGGGWVTKNPPVMLSELTTAGIGTAVGVLGYDTITQRLETLLAKTKALAHEGMTTYMYTGGLQLPPPTLTGSITSDLTLFSEVVGLKTSVADFRAGPDDAGLMRQMASQVALGSRNAGKPPIMHVHVGLESVGLELIERLVEAEVVPADVFVITHVNWSKEMLARAALLAQQGARIDITACITPETFSGAVGPADAVTELLEHGTPLKRITISSDSNGSSTLYNDEGRVAGVEAHPPGYLFSAFREILTEKVLPSEKALLLVSTNPARTLGLHFKKGRLARGYDADILLLDEQYNLHTLIVGGRLMVEAGQVVAEAFFE
jgi:beta-aspartyl-dipeptidase (metallo-type)